MTWDTIDPAYLKYLKAATRSPRTIELRLYQIRKLRNSYPELEAEQITDDVLVDYMGNPNWAPNTKGVVRSSLTGYFGFAFRKGLLPDLLRVDREGNPRTGYIFPGKDNGHIAPATVSRYVSKVLPPGVTCHKLRHRFATQVIKSGGELLALQRLMGHASVATTQGYVGIDDDQLRDAAMGAW